MKRLVVGAAAVLFAAMVLAQTAPPTPTFPPKPKAKAKGSSAKAPLDFTGVWVLDAKASTGVAPQMAGVVLQVRQNGNRIWIEQVESQSRMIVSEEIVVDGQKYEKGLGGGQKGTLEAAWGNDNTSLWLQAVAAAGDNPTGAVQRMIWRLRENGQTWTRQTRTIQPDGVKDTFLVFRKKETKKP